MAEQSAEYKLRVSAESGQADAALDNLAGKQATAKDSLESTAQAAQRMGDSIEAAGAKTVQAGEATAGLTAKQAEAKEQLEQATAAAQKWGVSIEVAKAALAGLRADAFQSQVTQVRNAMIATEQYANKLTAAEASMVEAASAAQKWGVSLEVARAALDKNAALNKAAEINALALAMRNANVATEESIVVGERAADVNEEQAESLHALQETLKDHQQQLMQNVFYVHRLAEGFKDLSLGGRAAGQGLMDISESLQYMLPPQLAMYVVIAQVVGMLAVMVTAHHGARDAAKEHGDAEKEAADAISKGTEAILKFADATSKVDLAVQTQQLQDFLKLQEQLITNQDRIDAQNDAHLNHVQELTKANHELALAQLKNQEQQDLNNATSELQRAQIEADYKRRETAMKGGDEQQAIQAEQELLAQQKTENDAKRAALVQDNTDRASRLKALQDDASTKASKAEGEGFQPNKAGSFEDAISDQTDRFKKAREDYAAAQAELDVANTRVAEATALMAAAQLTGNVTAIGAAKLPLTSAENSQKSAEIGVAQAQRDQIVASTQLADLRDAQAARESLSKDGDKLQSAIDKNTDEIGKLVLALGDITTKQQALSIQSETQAANTSTEQKVNDAAADKAQSDLHWKAWQDTIRKNEESRREKQKAQDQSFDNNQLLPAQEKLASDEKAFSDYQESVRQMADHAAQMGALGKAHADQTRQLAAVVKQKLDEMAEAVAADKEAIRQLQLNLKASRTNPQS